ncbi:Putative proximal rod protein [Nereida ignava]|uniref:Flagellar basal-body rod protein FlgF n=1 Tax=Nereida ignava TaxID=282199 RepID=A0A0U1NN69_9RHOB|nr:flagellar basal body rod C-terminal domain-containing protein [Nereida ignava]CRK76147.1 Putative proximal rod protein [Nereida ignava]SFJ57174.1 flagellar basal-body rod protein FlgF [Nereida ignava DSM 16309]
MDRMIHTALNTLKNLQNIRQATAQNLASVDIPGFRKDLPKEGRSVFINAMDSATARIYNLETGTTSFSEKQGVLRQLGAQTDVAIMSEGYFFVEPKNGEVALSRRGDFSVNGEGQLINGAQELMLDDGLQPIEMPPFSEFRISEIGEISVTPMDGPSGIFQDVAVLGTTSAQGEELTKGEDGQIRRLDGTVPGVDQQVKLVQGALEASNVDAVSELVQSIEAQRQFEMGVKFIKMAEDIDRGGAELMRLPQG